MAEKLQIYKCELCGNIVEVLHGGAGELVCCGKPMKLLAENTTDAANRKTCACDRKGSRRSECEGRRSGSPHAGQALYRMDTK